MRNGSEVKSADLFVVGSWIRFVDKRERKGDVLCSVVIQQ